MAPARVMHFRGGGTRTLRAYRGAKIKRAWEKGKKTGSGRNVQGFRFRRQRTDAADEKWRKKRYTPSPLSCVRRKIGSRCRGETAERINSDARFTKGRKSASQRERKNKTALTMRKKRGYAGTTPVLPDVPIDQASTYWKGPRRIGRRQEASEGGARDAIPGPKTARTIAAGGPSGLGVTEKTREEMANE